MLAGDLLFFVDSLLPFLNVSHLFPLIVKLVLLSTSFELLLLAGKFSVLFVDLVLLLIKFGILRLVPSRFIGSLLIDLARIVL